MTTDPVDNAKRWVEQLRTEMPLEDALLMAREAAAILRVLLEGHIADLTAALGQPAKPARREREAERQAARDVPVTQADATHRIATLLADSQEPLPLRSIRARTGATVEQAAVALKEIRGVVKHGRKYALKAGT